MICALALLTSGCQAKSDQQLTLAVGADQPAAEVVPPAPPPGLLAHVRVGSLPRVLDNVAAAGSRVGAWSLRPGELWPLVQEFFGATSDVADIVDWRRAVHVLVLDPARHPGAVAFILPVRHPDRALGQLSGRCQAHRQGALWVFTGGGRGLLPCRFVARTLEGGLLLAPDPAALRSLWRFALITAQQDLGGGAALEARVFAKAALAKLGFNAQKLDQLAKVGSLGLALAGGDLNAAPRIEAQLTRLFAYATSARDFGLAVHLGPEVVRVRLFATAQPRGALRRFIEGRRTSPRLDLAGLPHRAPVAVSLAAPPPGRPTTTKPKPGFEPGLVLGALLTQVPPGLRKPWGRFVSRLLGHRSTSRIALEPVDTGGLCLVAVVDHPRPKELAAAMHRDLAQGLDSLRKHLKDLPPAAKVFTSSRKGAGQAVQLQDIRLDGKWPAGSSALELLVKWIAGGDTLRLATAPHRRGLVVALGAGALGQARAALRRWKGPPGGRLGPVLPPGRLGRIHLSLVELVRAVPILGVGMTLPKRDTGGLELHWGVNAARRQVDAGLHLPLAHLMASAPLWQWLMNKLAAQTQGFGRLAATTGPEPDDAL